MKKKLRVFETFSGIGAQAKSLELIKEKLGYDFEIVATSEWDIYAVVAYAYIHNLDKTHQFNNDIWNTFVNSYDLSLSGKTPATKQQLNKLSYDTKQKVYSAFKETNNLGSILKIKGDDIVKIGGIDLLTYSFPCQDLSVAGSFHGFNQGMAKGSGTRSGLLWEIERILFELNELQNKTKNEYLPKFLLLENVKNMLSSRHKDQYNLWLKQLKSLGYSTRTFVLNTNKYGSPQHRERVYALSILNYDGLTDENGEIIDINEPELIKEIGTQSLKDIIKEDYSNPIYKEEAIQSCPNRTPSRLRMYEQNYKLNDYKKYKYSRTVTTKQDRHPNAGVISLNEKLFDTKLQRNTLNKANYRFLTPRETYLLMGFEEQDFEKVLNSNVVKKEKLYQQAGNSINVKTIAPIMLLIQKYFNNEPIK